MNLLCCGLRVAGGVLKAWWCVDMVVTELEKIITCMGLTAGDLSQNN